MKSFCARKVPTQLLSTDVDHAALYHLAPLWARGQGVIYKVEGHKENETSFQGDAPKRHIAIGVQIHAL